MEPGNENSMEQGEGNGLVLWVSYLGSNKKEWNVWNLMTSEFD